MFPLLALPYLFRFLGYCFTLAFVALPSPLLPLTMVLTSSLILSQSPRAVIPTTANTFSVLLFPLGWFEPFVMIPQILERSDVSTIEIISHSLKLFLRWLLKLATLNLT